MGENSVFKGKFSVWKGKKLALFAFLCVLGVVFFVRCSLEPFDPEGYRCESDSNCLDGYYCKKGICVRRQEPDGDAAGEREGFRGE